MDPVGLPAVQCGRDDDVDDDVLFIDLIIGVNENEKTTEICGLRVFVAGVHVAFRIRAWIRRLRYNRNCDKMQCGWLSGGRRALVHRKAALAGR